MDVRVDGVTHRESTGTPDRDVAEDAAQARFEQLRNEALRSYAVPEEQRKVLIGKDAFLYKQKAPFVVSGHSVKGGLEWDESTDRVKCHECGMWLKFLPTHIAKAHAIDAAEYKVRHGLNQGSALVSEAIRQRLVKEGKQRYESSEFARRRPMTRDVAVASTRRIGIGASMECRNRRATCPEQLLERVGALAEKLGRTPSTSELLAVGIHAKGLRAMFGKSVSDIVGKPKNLGGRPHAVPNVALLADLLRDFWVRFHRLPSVSDERRGLIPKRSRFVKVFGSMSAALEYAGLGEVSHRVAEVA